MGAPNFYDKVIEPPQNDFSPDAYFRWQYDLWQRTGGYETYVVNLNGLEASVPELNTLVGINTNLTVQAQLDAKFNLNNAGTMAYQNANAVAITGGTAINLAISDSTYVGEIEVPVGGSTATAEVGAAIYSDFTAVSNTITAEEDLMGYSLLANTLVVNNDYIELKGWGTFAVNTNNKRLRLKFGGATIYDSGAIAANAGSWLITATIARTGPSTQQAIVSVLSSNALLTPPAQFTLLSANLALDNLIQFTSECDAASDLTQYGFSIQWFPASS